ncbi:hypothetical protein DUNSADRAFT_11789 [Dunaliella salina]|uniref:Encoded protein n=1 Tax=Dunaliella salina TaxID=3046 RepID=A0ABQ7GCL1_DUNSA|nr:hypothetical protein DUNSADRAFT_11789 [Dunaliella salina]|eukprot:KAF5832347.1 hypothetical protein DUNSADRAFT_11789 [Dunaliella salina]
MPVAVQRSYAGSLDGELASEPALCSRPQGALWMSDLDPLLNQPLFKQPAARHAHVPQLPAVPTMRAHTAVPPDLVPPLFARTH